MKHLIGFRKSEPVTVEKRGTSTACRIEYGVQCPATVPVIVSVDAAMPITTRAGLT